MWLFQFFCMFQPARESHAKGMQSKDHHKIQQAQTNTTHMNALCYLDNRDTPYLPHTHTRPRTHTKHTYTLSLISWWFEPSQCHHRSFSQCWLEYNPARWILMVVMVNGYCHASLFHSGSYTVLCMVLPSQLCYRIDTDLLDSVPKHTGSGRLLWAEVEAKIIL